MIRKNALFSIILFFNSIGLLASSSQQECVKAAIESGDVTKVDALLRQIVAQKNHADINFHDLLTYAIGNSTCAIVRRLIQARGRAITIEDAIVTKHIKDPEMLKLLVNQSNEDMKILRCFLYVAIVKGWNDIVRFLIEEKKVRLFINKKQKSAVHFAAEHGTYETMKLLLELTPGLAEYPYADNYTPLHDAAKYGKLKMVQLLVGKYRVAVDPVFGLVKRMPLHYAAREGYLDIARYLLNAGARIDVQDAFGLTPYAHARLAKKKEVEQFFKEELERRALLDRALRPVYVVPAAVGLLHAEQPDLRIGQSGSGQNDATAPESPANASDSPNAGIDTAKSEYPQFPELRLDVLGKKDIRDVEHYQDDSSSSSPEDLQNSILFFPRQWWQAGELRPEGSIKRPRDEREECDDLAASSSSISERVKKRRSVRKSPGNIIFLG